MRNARRRLSVVLAAGLAGLGAVSWATGSARGQASPQPSPEPAAALVGGVLIPVRDVDAAIAGRLFELESQQYQLRRKALDERIAESLLAREAAARGVAPEALFRDEVDAKASPVTEEQKRARYEAARARLQGRSEAEAMALVADALRQEHLRERRDEFVRELRRKHGVRVLLEPPRAPVEEAGAPALGPAAAPVTIVEFSDFQCPYCGRVAPTLKRLLESHPGQLRLVFRDYPLPIHPHAAKAAEAAACAREQGRFWEMHDRLFANQQALLPAELKRHAAELGLDAAGFAECLDSGRMASVWQKGLQDGARYGVSSTPAFFVNGRPLVGAQPYEAFADVVEEELQRAPRTPPAK